MPRSGCDRGLGGQSEGSAESVRIIAGAHRGTRLAGLGKGDAAAHLRPTPDRVREALFNVLGAQVDWDGLRVLDLFAGTGALGLEALSRGAARHSLRPHEEGTRCGTLIKRDFRGLFREI